MTFSRFRPTRVLPVRCLACGKATRGKAHKCPTMRNGYHGGTVELFPGSGLRLAYDINSSYPVGPASVYGKIGYLRPPNTPTKERPMSIETIPLALIDPPEFNSRLDIDEESIKELALSMPKLEDQINPITVEKVSDRYLVVTGSRRVAAAKLNGWKSIRADVKEPSSKVHRMTENLVENAQRKDLTLFEQARAVAGLRREGMKGPEITAVTGFSKQKITNIVVMYENLADIPEIAGPWRDQHKAAKYDFLGELARMKGKTPEETREMQIATWNARVKLTNKFEAEINPDESEDDDDDGEGESNGSGKAKAKKAKTHPVPRSRYLSIVRALNAKKVSGTKLAIDCMKALIGDSNEIKTVWSADAGDNP